jgi:hypothetical protein
MTAARSVKQKPKPVANPRAVVTAHVVAAPTADTTLDIASIDIGPDAVSNYPYLSPTQKRRMILALFAAENGNQNEVARKLKVDPSTISRALTKAGVSPRLPRKTPRTADVPTSTKRIPPEVQLRAKERVHEALLPLNRAERAEVLAWAHDALVTR